MPVGFIDTLAEVDFGLEVALGLEVVADVAATFIQQVIVDGILFVDRYVFLDQALADLCALDMNLDFAAAVDAARTRFRPIIMTSFAFILGVVPLLTATGAGANARASLGLSVVTGMLASTCLAVLFVPSFFVVLQRLEEWWQARSTAATRRTA